MKSNASTEVLSVILIPNNGINFAPYGAFSLHYLVDPYNNLI